MGYPPQGGGPGIASSDLDTIKSKDTGLHYNRETDSLEFQGEAQTHQSDLFPENSGDSCTLTAGATPNVFGAWSEIVDSPSGNNLTDVFAAMEGHLVGLLIEDLDTDDKRYLFEIGYGETTKTVIMRHRFVSGVTKKLQALQYIRVRSVLIPAGEKVYYRMMCETGSATCEVSFRYHEH